MGITLIPKKIPFPNGKMRRLSCTALALLILLQAGCSLHVDRVVVPELVQVGGTATLECWYREDRDKLYSLKWWQGDYQFYQYLPPDRKHFPVKGIYVDWTATTELNKLNRPSRVETVVLYRIGLETGGVFKCEVMANSDFRTEFKMANMTVAYIPDKPPSITLTRGLQTSNITLGQKLSLNCSAPYASPPTVITWYINDRRVNSSLVTIYPPRYNANNLAQTMSSLEFIANEQFILPGRSLVVTCLASQVSRNHIQLGYSKRAHLTFRAKQVPSFWDRIFSQGSTINSSKQRVLIIILQTFVVFLVGLPALLFSRC